MSGSQPTNAVIQFTLNPRFRDLGNDQTPLTSNGRSASRRIPRITKLLALAIRFEGLLREGDVKNCAALAQAGQVSRARLTQIMSLLDLAPAIQEHILYMSCQSDTPDPIRERQLRSVTEHVRWDEQQRLYEELLIGRKGHVGRKDLKGKEGAGVFAPGSERIVR
jgi:hypothetical protein